MRTFRCKCGARIFFTNTSCIQCKSLLGFDPVNETMVALGEVDPGTGQPKPESHGLQRCANGTNYDVCNWLVKEPGLCQSCQLNEVIPNLEQAGNLALWHEVEAGKRHLVYTLNQLQLPVRPKRQDDNGLAFRIMEDEPDAPVLTGHASGVITLNLREADPVARANARKELQERYRTVLGHLRHEVGHYYWERLIRDDPQQLNAFRKLFGDEREDYAEALKRHYSSTTTPQELEGHYVSAYASAHAWEDWAETWAHYLHIVDTMETARCFRLATEHPEGSHRSRADFDALLAEWADVTVTLNALNRSMGMPDAYPFAPSGQVIDKLRFVASAIDRGATDQNSMTTNS